MTIVIYIYCTVKAVQTYSEGYLWSEVYIYGEKVIEQKLIVT